jgi:hypothetical protein
MIGYVFFALCALTGLFNLLLPFYIPCIGNHY